MNNSKSATSIMFAGTADGKLLPPYVVYRSESLWDTWLQGGPPGVRFNRSKSGWFDSSCFQDWFFTIVIPWAKEFNGKKAIIGDNLSSHFSTKVLQACAENNISFICLPPNATHALQPLDVAFFAPLKKTWRKILYQWKSRQGKRKSTIPKSEFPSLLADLMLELAPSAATNLKSGFRACSIFPVDKDVVLHRLPDLDSNNENESAASLAVLQVLKQLRGNDIVEPINQIRQKRKKHVLASPGKSISAADIPVQPINEARHDHATGSGTGSGNSNSGSTSHVSKEKGPSRKRKRAAHNLPSTSNDSNGTPIGYRYSCQLWNRSLFPESDSDADLPEETRETESESETNQNLSEGTWVLVKLSTKKTEKHFVGQILDVDVCGFQVKFLKRSGDRFVWPEPDDVSIIDEEQIIMGLPKPSFYRRGALKFSYSFYGFKI